MEKAERLMSEGEVQKCVSKLVSEILKVCKPIEEFVIIGIRTRGVPLAERIRRGIESATGKLLPMGILDITLYRDDLRTKASQPVVRPTRLGFDIEGKRVILVDDVLYTGRTARAALTELADFGRPSTVRYAVLIDRGQRELPIAPDFVGTTLQVAADAMIRVRLKEVDGFDGVILER